MDAPGLLSVLSDHGFADTSTTRKVAALNDTIWEICDLKPWTFLEKTINLTFNGSSAVPTNWPTDFRASLILVELTSGNDLYPIRRDEFLRKFATLQTQVGTPNYYYFLARVLKAYPIPNATDVVTMDYLQIPAAITDTTTEANIVIPPRFHSCITEGALKKLYALEDDPELAAQFGAFYSEKIGKMLESEFVRQYDRPDTIEITDWDDLYS